MRLGGDHWLGFGRSGAVRRAAAGDLLSQIQTPTLAWGDIAGVGSIPWYSDAGTTPAVPTNGVYRLTEHRSGTNYAEQSTSSARATLTDGTPYDYMTFDGGDWLATPNNLGKSGDFALEMVAVGKVGADNQCIWSCSAGEYDAQGLAFVSEGGKWNVAFRANSQLFGNSDTNVHVFRVVKTPGAMNTTTRLWVDGVEQSLSAGTGSTPNMVDGPMVFGKIIWNGLDIYQSTGRMYCGLYYATPLASDALRTADDAKIATWFGL